MEKQNNDLYIPCPKKGKLSDKQLPKEELINIIKEPRETQKESLARLRFPMILVQRFEEVYGNVLRKTQKEIEGISPAVHSAPSNSHPSTIMDKNDLNVQDHPSSQEQSEIQRHSTKCRIKCREIAKKIWSQNPNITIREMSESEEILEYTKNQQGELYSEKTIRDWIKDLCPNRSPGRPKKS